MKNLSAVCFFYITIAGSTASCLACVSLLDSSFKSMLWLAIAVAVCMMLVRASSATKHLLWATTMLGLLLLPVATVLLPEWRVLPGWFALENRIEYATLVGARADDPMERFAPESLPSIFEEEVPGPVEDNHLIEGDAANRSFAKSPYLPLHAPMMDSDFHRESLNPGSRLQERPFIRINALFVLAVWATGCMIGILPMIAAVIRLRCLEGSHQNRYVANPKIARRVESLSKTLGVSPPLVILGPEGAMPMVWSFRRSRLLLPSDAAQWSRSRLDAVLLHEFIHLRRRDPFVCTMASVARAMNWFNPLAWYAVKRLRVECEQACDDDVLRMGVEPCEYASHLLALSTNMSFLSATGPVAIAMASKHRLEERIVAILNEKQNRSGVKFGHLMVALIAGTFFAATLGSMATTVAVAKNLQEDFVEEVAQTPQAPFQASSDDSPEKTSDTENKEELNHLSTTQAQLEKTKFLDLSLEECIAFALSNAQLVPAGVAQAYQAGKAKEARSEFESRWRSFGSFDAGHSSDPLTQGRGSPVNRVPVVLTRMDENISIGQFEERIQNLLRDVEFAYWDLYAMYYRVDNAKTVFDSTSIAWKNATTNRSTVTKTPEAQARITYYQIMHHQSKERLDLAIAGDPQGTAPCLFSRENNLRSIVGWGAEDGQLIRPSDNPTVGRVEFDWTALREEALIYNLDMKKQKWSVKQKELELVSLRNQVLPDVNIGLAYQWVGAGSPRGAPNSDNSRVRTSTSRAHQVLQGSDVLDVGDIRLGFTPNPIGSRRIAAELTSIQLSLAREHRALQQTEKALIFKLDQMRDDIESLHRQMTQHSEALSAAKKISEVSQAKFDSGESGNSDQALDDLLRAQQSRYRASQNKFLLVAEYNKSLVDLHSLKGSLLKHHNFVVDHTAKQPENTDQPNGDSVNHPARK